jgi:Uncharacterized ACR, COG1678
MRITALHLVLRVAEICCFCCCWLDSLNSGVADAFSPASRTISTVNTFGGSKSSPFTSWKPLRFSEGDDGASSSPGKNATAMIPDEREDWRDVRARLVHQFRKLNAATEAGATERSVQNKRAGNSSSTNRSTTPNSNTSSASYAWAYDSGGVIERGSLIVSHPVQDFACGGLRQQYFTKSVVLVVKDDATFTKGVILNRNYITYQIPNTLNRNSNDGYTGAWTVYYGGDVQGLDSPETDFTCLHRLKSAMAMEFSHPIVKDIQVSRTKR